MNGTVVYREINDAPDLLVNWLDDRMQLYNVVDPKGNEHLYVENDIPRDWEITPMIIEHTTGFALFTEDGEFIGEYRSLDRVLRAQESAKVTVSAEVDIEEEDEAPAPEVTPDEVASDDL